MKKRIIALAAAVVLLLTACSAADAEIENEQVLLTIDGQTLITGEYFNNYLAEQRFIEEYYDDKQASAAEIFKILAQYTVAEYLAKKYSITVDTAQIEAEYDDYYENAQEDNDLRRYLKNMKNSMGMTDEEFRAYRINDAAMLEYSEELISEIASEYPSVTDADILLGLVSGNLYALLEGREIVISYPGLEKWEIDFDYILNT